MSDPKQASLDNEAALTVSTLTVPYDVSRHAYASMQEHHVRAPRPPSLSSRISFVMLPSSPDAQPIPRPSVWERWREEVYTLAIGALVSAAVFGAIYDHYGF